MGEPFGSTEGYFPKARLRRWGISRCPPENSLGVPLTLRGSSLMAYPAYTRSLSGVGYAATHNVRYTNYRGVFPSRSSNGHRIFNHLRPKTDPPTLAINLLY